MNLTMDVGPHYLNAEPVLGIFLYSDADLGFFSVCGYFMILLKVSDKRISNFILFLIIVVTSSTK